jgi:hypothetical protein
MQSRAREGKAKHAQRLLPLLSPNKKYVHDVRRHCDSSLSLYICLSFSLPLSHRLFAEYRMSGCPSLRHGPDGVYEELEEDELE